MKKTYMLLITVCFVVCVISSCDRDSFGEESFVTSPRILSIKTEPAVFSPGDSFSASMLMDRSWNSLEDATVKWTFGKNVFVNTDSFSMVFSEEEIADLFSNKDVESYEKHGRILTDVSVEVSFLYENNVRELSASAPVIIFDENLSNLETVSNPTIKNISYSINKSDTETLSEMYIPIQKNINLKELTIELQTESGTGPDTETDFFYSWFVSRPLSHGEIPGISYDSNDGRIVLDFDGNSVEGLMLFSVLVKEPLKNHPYEINKLNDFVTIAIDIGEHEDEDSSN